MKISVITVVLNAADTIENTIQSVLSQTHSDTEYIIIDGGSTDGTVDIIQKYEDRLSFWVSEPDAGIYYAMNGGIDHATGDVINFLNSGDLFYDDSVLAGVDECFADHPETDIVIGRELIEGKISKEYLSDPPISVYVDRFIPHQATFVRRNVYERIGLFDVAYRICADYDWILRAYALGYVIQWRDDIWAVYDPDGISSTPAALAEQYEISAKYLKQTGFIILIPEADRFYTDMFRKVFFRNLLKSDRYDERVEAGLQKLMDSRAADIRGYGTVGQRIYRFLRRYGIKVGHIYDEDPGKCGVTDDGTAVSMQGDGLKHKVSLYHSDDAEQGYAPMSRVLIISSEDHENEIATELNRAGFIQSDDYWTYTQFSSMLSRILLNNGYDDGGFRDKTGLDYEFG